MILLVQRLGPEFIVWDRAATIDFLRPGLSTVSASVRVTEEEVAAIRKATRDGEKHLPQWTLDVIDDAGEVVARVAKTLYIRRKRQET